MATLLWTGVFLFLLLEIIVLLFMIIPLPSIVAKHIPVLIRKVFARQTVFIIVLTLLSLCFLESIRQQYSAKVALSELDPEDPMLNHVSTSMKLFRSERNTYLSGYALFLIFVIFRVALLLEAVDKKRREADDSNNTSEKSIPAIEDEPTTVEETTVEETTNEEHKKND
ncbi:Endoplasmic reticulum transmembrane protein [Entamoeba marina]